MSNQNGTLHRNTCGTLRLSNVIKYFCRYGPSGSLNIRSRMEPGPAPDQVVFATKSKTTSLIKLIMGHARLSPEIVNFVFYESQHWQMVQR